MSFMLTVVGTHLSVAQVVRSSRRAILSFLATGVAGIALLMLTFYGSGGVDRGSVRRSIAEAGPTTHAPAQTLAPTPTPIPDPDPVTVVTASPASRAVPVVQRDKTTATHSASPVAPAAHPVESTRPSATVTHAETGGAEPPAPVPAPVPVPSQAPGPVNGCAASVSLLGTELSLC